MPRPARPRCRPWEKNWHVEPNDPRTFDIDKANQMLDAAGYPRGADGTRVDKQNKPINLRLYVPNTDPSYAKDAQFIQGWFGQVGVKVSTQVLDEGTLVTDEALDTTKPVKGQLDYDMVIWGWVGDPDPNALLQILLTSSIGSTSDSQWSNAQYDQLYDQQNQAATDAQRHDYMAQMQQIFYDQAPYDILYYDNNLDAYHTDKFAGWQNQPVVGGAPFFQDGSINYTLLTDAANATPAPAASTNAAPTAASSGRSGGHRRSGSGAACRPTRASSGSALPLIIGVIAIAALLIGFMLPHPPAPDRHRRGRRVSQADEPPAFRPGARRSRLAG